jgi:hypothetical protein
MCAFEQYTGFKITFKTEFKCDKQANVLSTRWQQEVDHKEHQADTISDAISTDNSVQHNICNYIFKTNMDKLISYLHNRKL